MPLYTDYSIGNQVARRDDGQRAENGGARSQTTDAASGRGFCNQGLLTGRATRQVGQLEVPLQRK